ncbi:MAG: flippase [Anaerolineae bacterium]
MPPKKRAATRGQIRGSTLLLAGRFLSKGVNFASQVMIVRYLAKSDYGAFAYALSIVALGETVVTFGLNRAITRFVPIYHERHDYDKLFGTIIMAASTTLSLGIAMILFLYGLRGVIAQSFIGDQQALTLLLILVFLAPVQAIDKLLNGMFAVFSRPRAIFFRKYVMGPGFRLSVVLLLILGHSDVHYLASGYLAVGALAVAIYTVLLFHTLREQNLFQHFNLQTINIPAREVLAFTIPLLTTDLVYTVMNSLDAVILEHFHGTVDVAALRAVQPTATLNRLVFASFGLLFTTLAARMFARDDREGINNLYWQNAVWVAVASFPIFAMTFSLARPLTVLLYGIRYEQSATILALLSFGYYFHAALGFNGTTLMVFGKVRYIVVLNVVAAVANLGVNLLLIPRYGALGAAIGTCGTLVAHNILKQAGLALGTGIRLFDRRYLKVYASITSAALGLLLVQGVTSAPFYVSFVLAIVTSLLVLRLNRESLDIEHVIPELLRFPLARYLLGDG